MSSPTLLLLQPLQLPEGETVTGGGSYCFPDVGHLPLMDIPHEQLTLVTTSL